MISGSASGGNSHVDDGAGDRDDAAVLQLASSGLVSGLAVAVMVAPGSAVAAGSEEILVAGFDGVGKEVGVDERAAAAQGLGATDDLHDLGGDRSWRARFITRVRLVISSSALSVAAFIARWRAACSDAAASSWAAKMRAST